MDIYVSVDIEADGPIPGRNSMLSFGAVAYTSDGVEIARYNANLQPLPEAITNPQTMEFWEKNPDAYAAATAEPCDPALIMPEFSRWLERLGGKPVFVGYPVTYDFMWLHWYLIAFNDLDPFSHAGLDIKTLAWSQLGGSFHRASKRNFPKRWFSKKHKHIAVDDAAEQGELFFTIVGEIGVVVEETPR